ncbi:MAG: DUF5312 domain-containing protein [Treponema sp.]|nr:DUF5312 domain-containing protein [Treponema sp.]
MGFLDTIIGLFGGGNDPEAAKKKRLQQLVKDLGQNKYSKFYRPKTGELGPAFAKCFFDIYKVVSSTQVFLQNAAKSEQLKHITLDAFLDKDLLALKDNLSAVTIQEKAQTMPVKDLSAAIKRELSNFTAAFDNTRINNIDNCYNTIISLVNFVCFDFFFLLKKFDPAINERNLNYQPKFGNVKAADLSDAIKDFMEFSAAVEMDWDWKTTLSVLKTYKEGMDVINPDHWAKVIRLLKDLSRTRIFELIVQHTSGDPLWQSIPRTPDERMADTILDAKKAEIEGAVSKIQNDKRSAQVEQLAKTIFGSAEIERMANYTAKGNDAYYKKNFDGYTKTAAINYIKAYLLDFFKKEIKELCDLILVRGQWSNIVLSQPMSDAYHEMAGLLDKISAFDDSVGEKGEHGSRIKQAMLKVDRDKGQGKYIRIILKTVNNNAQRMINSTATAFTTIGKNFKSLFEDSQKKPAEIIMNWKELESASEEPLVKRLAEDYKRMYYFVQLLQFFTGPLEEEENPPASMG